MNIVAHVKNEKIKDIQSVVHIDKTSRVHSVAKKENEIYYKLIESFYKKTSIPLLLNTSFNLHGCPIVNSIDQALDIFLKTNLLQRRFFFSK